MFQFLILFVVTLSYIDVYTLDINQSEYYNNLGYGALQSGSLTEAEKFFDIAIGRNPNNKYYYNNIAVVYIRKKQYEKAYSSLQKAIAIDAVYTKGLVNISVCCFYLGKYFEAYRYYCRSVKSNPEYVKKRFQYTKVLERVEKRKDEVPHDETVDIILRYVKEQKNSFKK